MLKYFTVNTSIELICFLTALLYLRRDKSFAWRGIIIYLFITCLTELFAIYLKKQLHHNNQWPYNLSIIFEATFISLLFLNLFNKYFNSKPVILGGLALLLVIYCYEVKEHHFVLFRDTTNDLLNSTTNDSMSALFSLYSLYYFYLLLKDKDYINFEFSANFWWVVGVFFYYFGSTTINLLRDRLTSDYYGFTNTVLVVLVWIIYGCWSYSFICRRWATTTSNS